MDDEDKLFEKLVAEAIDNIPTQYQEKMKSVAILVRDTPTFLQHQKLQLRGRQLFGLYEGVPLPQRGGAVYMTPPDVITIFKHPMMELFPTEATLKKQIFETLWHEVAHYFGLNHEQIHEKQKSRKM